MLDINSFGHENLSGKFNVCQNEKTKRTHTVWKKFDV